MKNREFAPQEPKTVQEAVRRFLDDDTEGAIAFLRANREEVAEFFLQVRDAYSEGDRTTPFVKLAQLIKSLL